MKVKAVFEIREIKQDWKPPFARKASASEKVAAENEDFDAIPEHEGEYVFRLLKVDGSKVLVRFSHLYTLKGHEHPGNRQIWLVKDEPVAFTYLWGEDGTTKKIVLKEIVGDDFALEPEAEGVVEPAGAEAEPVIEQVFEGKKD